MWATAKQQRLSAAPTKPIELQSELELSPPVLANVEVTGIASASAQPEPEPENEVPPIRAPSKSNEMERPRSGGHLGYAARPTRTEAS